MSTFSNDTGTVNIDFSFLFDLRTTPILKITDTSTYSAEQTDVKVFIKVTRPDGIIRDFPTNPDISGTSGSLSTYDFTLPLDPLSGQPAYGTYKVEYKFTVGDQMAVTVTKSHNFEFAQIAIKYEEDVDEFTPEVKIKDTTPNYNILNYTVSTISRDFSASVGSTMTMVDGTDRVVSIANSTTSGTSDAARTYDLKDPAPAPGPETGTYYDTEYTVTINVTVTYTHSTYSWVQAIETFTKTFKVNVHKPPTKAGLIDEFDQLKNLVERYDKENKTLFRKYKTDYEQVVTSFNHLVLRLNDNDSDNENTEIMRDILLILRNDVPRTHTNFQLVQTPLTIYSDLGSISWSDIQNLPTYSPFDTYEFEQTEASTEWTINHNLGKHPSVMVVDSQGNQVFADVVYDSNNQLTVNFYYEVSGKVYLN